MANVTIEGSASVVGRLRPLLGLLRPHRVLIGAAVLSGMGHQLVVLATATTAAWLVGQSIAHASVPSLVPGLVLLGILIIPVTMLPWLESFLAHVAAFRVLADIRARVFDAFERLAPGYLLERRSGDLGATAISDVELLERFFAHALSPLIVACTVPLTAMIGLGLIHWSLALALMPALALLVSVPYWLRRQAAAQGDALRGRLGELSAEAVDLLQGLRELLTFGRQKEWLERFAEREAGLLASKVAHSRRAGLEHAATDALTAVGLLASVVVGATLASRGLISVSMFPVAVILAATSLLPVAAVLDVVRDLNLAAGAAERVWAILRAPPRVVDRVTAAPERRVEARLSFEDVGFRYTKDLRWAVHRVSFEIRPGETVALVGHSGAGKSTLSSLALRLWDVDQGRVRVGGHDVRQLPQQTLRELITLVPQDVYLFNTSLRENIRIGAPEADDRAVEAAARAAMAHAFISELPAGYDTEAGELGTRLSGGQRQRIAIARALLKDCPILVMDEAVSNLDAASEAEITAAIASVRRGRTSLIIAHRLSTIRAADRLVVLDRGRVVEQGTHGELVAQRGRYARLMASQLSHQPLPSDRRGARCVEEEPVDEGGMCVTEIMERKMMEEAASERVDWQEWSRRWDAQQSFLVVRREERFRVMLDVAQQVLGRPPSTILDLACGTGDVARRALQRFPNAQLVGVDADPLLLAIARGAIGDAGGRARWVRADLRDARWPAAVEGTSGFELVLSSTALHWLPTTALVAVYHALHGLVAPGGVVLNADVIPPLGAGKLATAADELRTRAARDAQSQGAGERYAEWWDSVARDPALSELYQERAKLFEDHPEDLELPTADLHVQTLRDAGFREAAVLWRFFDYGVAAAVKGDD